MKNLTVPIVKNMKATSLPKAYFLNALCMGIIAAFTIETRIMLENEKSKFSGYFNTLLSVKVLTERQKIFIVFMSAFVIAVITYSLMYLLFGFGGGMLI